jgi:hypothetical protein
MAVLLFFATALAVRSLGEAKVLVAPFLSPDFFAYPAHG